MAEKKEQASEPAQAREGFILVASCRTCGEFVAENSAATRSRGVRLHLKEHPKHAVEIKEQKRAPAPKGKPATKPAAPRVKAEKPKPTAKPKAAKPKPAPKEKSKPAAAKPKPTSAEQSASTPPAAPSAAKEEVQK
jgi:hypothetical protein